MFVGGGEVFRFCFKYKFEIYQIENQNIQKTDMHASKDQSENSKLQNDSL